MSLNPNRETDATNYPLFIYVKPVSATKFEYEETGGSALPDPAMSAMVFLSEEDAFSEFPGDGEELVVYKRLRVRRNVLTTTRHVETVK